MSKLPIEYEVIESTDDFVYGRVAIEDTHRIYASLAKELNGAEDEAGEVGNPGDGNGLYEEVRKSSLVWIQKSKKAKKMLWSLVSEINDEHWQLDIEPDPPDVQFTMYRDPDDHYDWHQDIYPEDNNAFIREVSISLCLSHDDEYEGAELMLKDGSETNVRYWKMRYGDFIIFPSLVEHRVNALRSGERESLVVWYGHDPE